jgi:hypothetical protein
MGKIGRNSPCPCGSGKKYKRCCAEKEAQMMDSQLPPGRFRYEAGSYGGPGSGYAPSIIGYKEVGPDSWAEHLCIAKPDAVFENHENATFTAIGHLASAKQAQLDSGGSPQEFAMSLRHEGYKSVSDFRIVETGGKEGFRHFKKDNGEETEGLTG